MSLTPAEFAQHLAGAPERLALGVRAELAATAPVAVDAARMRLSGHDQTGKLRASVHAEVQGQTLTLGAAAPYASFVEAKVGFIQGAVDEVLPGLERRLSARAVQALEPR